MSLQLCALDLQRFPLLHKRLIVLSISHRKKSESFPNNDKAEGKRGKCTTGQSQYPEKQQNMIYDKNYVVQNFAELKIMSLLSQMKPQICWFFSSPNMFGVGEIQMDFEALSVSFRALCESCQYLFLTTKAQQAWWQANFPAMSSVDP